MKHLSFFSMFLSVFPFAAAAKETCWQRIGESADPKIVKAVASEFVRVHGIQLNWREALEVSDDQEGNNCVFSADSGHSVVIPVEDAAEVSPNKIGSP